jgi:hypothetical protein
MNQAIIPIALRWNITEGRKWINYVPVYKVLGKTFGRQKGEESEQIGIAHNAEHGDLFRSLSTASKVTSRTLLLVGETKNIYVILTWNTNRKMLFWRRRNRRGNTKLFRRHVVRTGKKMKLVQNVLYIKYLIGFLI